jgi:hypothetical protein
MNTNLRVSLILMAVGFAVLGAFLFLTNSFPFQSLFDPRAPRPPMTIPGDLELYYIIQTVISAINMALIIVLLVTYTSMYSKTRSEFTLGLILFSGVLLLNSLTSNPLLHLLFGFRGFGIGPFAVLPDLFTMSALVVLLYLTFKY